MSRKIVPASLEKHKSSFFSALLSVLLFTAILFSAALPAEAVSRGAVVSQIITALGLPLWKGDRHFPDVPSSHPHARSIETAAALGILLPGTHFYPDIEATRAEALGFAFLAMGWRREGRIVQHLAPESISASLPLHLGAFHAIASEINFPAPDSFLDAPEKNCSPANLRELAQWLVQCRRNRLIWDKEFPGHCGSLRVHRENAGYPPSSWAVQITGIFSQGEAEKRQRELKKRGLQSHILSDGSGYTLRLGPYKHYFRGWLSLLRIPPAYCPVIVPYAGRTGGALFWAAIKGTPQALSPDIVFASALEKPKMSLSAMAAETGAEGAVNGGYFTGSTPIGTLYDEGLPASSAYKNRSAVGWNSRGEVFFGNGHFQAFLQTEKQHIPFTEINVPGTIEGMELVTPHAGIWERLSKGALISQFREGKLAWRTYGQGIQAVPPQGYLSVVRGNMEKTVREIAMQSPARILLKWSEPQMARMEGVVQGGPMLFAGKQIWEKNEGLPTRFIQNKHPRTLVGFDGQEMWWIVIDGRNSWHSTGVTLPEARRIAYSLGLSSALNLDGGGSSTLWWQGMIINSPSEGRERPLPYGIFFGRTP